MDIQLIYRGEKTAPQVGDRIIFDREACQAHFCRGQDPLFMLGCEGKTRLACIEFRADQELDETHARRLFAAAGLPSSQIVRVPIVGNIMCFGVTSSSGVAA